MSAFSITFGLRRLIALLSIRRLQRCGKSSGRSFLATHRSAWAFLGSIYVASEQLLVASVRPKERAMLCWVQRHLDGSRRAACNFGSHLNAAISSLSHLPRPQRLLVCLPTQSFRCLAVGLVQSLLSVGLVAMTFAAATAKLVKLRVPRHANMFEAGSARPVAQHVATDVAVYTTVTVHGVSAIDARRHFVVQLLRPHGRVNHIVGNAVAT
jgi:hypothetical protein